MIKGSKMVADIGDSYSVERDAHGDDESAKEIGSDIVKLVAMWGRK